MRKPSFHFAASEQKNGKGKKLLLPLVFSIVALLVVVVVLNSVRTQFTHAAAESGMAQGQVPMLPAAAESTPQEEVQKEEPEEVALDEYPEAGNKLGHLTVSGTAVDCDVYYGDSEAEFSKGAGIFKGGKIPGEGGTILMGGHTGTYFRDFESVQAGDEVTLTTDYGEYHYVVTNTKVATDTDTSAYELNAQEENLIMYTCYPFGTIEYTDERFFVYCDYVSGPVIVPQNP